MHYTMYVHIFQKKKSKIRVHTNHDENVKFIQGHFFQNALYSNNKHNLY